jgi:hypothetical protein
MAKRISVGKRIAKDRSTKRGFDALFSDIPVQSDTPVHHSTSVQAKPKKFEKGTFYFDPDDLAQLEKVWPNLMGQGIKCNKSEIVSILLGVGLEEHVRNPKNSPLARRLTGKRRRG